MKFLAAAGSLVGAKALWVSFLLGTLIAAALAVVMLRRERGALTRLKHRLVLVLSGVWHRPASSDRAGAGRPLPLVVPLSAGLLLVGAARLFM